jgi:membrane glycosyltransferase
MDRAALSTALARAIALSLALAAAFTSALLFLQFAAATGLQAIDAARAALIGITAFWLAWGAVGGLLGLFYRERTPPELVSDADVRGRTVILMPIYQEDPVATFSRVAAIDASLEAAGARNVDVAVLSDTQDPEIARREAFWFARLHAERRGQGRIYYRRRRLNTGRKAGNIAEFFATSGGAYDYALILDADSLMEGETILAMIRRMEADPGLGLLQTLPRIAGARSRFGRIMQFSASLYSPIFARGLAQLQGTAGPFWGHNALVRVRAFAESCHLPPLSGRPPFGGHILSHDYVEAALLARRGWRVRLDPDLGGSYEGGPEDLLEYAKRDRRWCQGNLQYTRLLHTPGLAWWSRFSLLQAVMAYVVPVLWFALIVTTVPAVLLELPPDYFPDGPALFPVFPSDETAKAVGLAVGVVALLLLPKLLILAKALVLGAGRQFGGGLRMTASVVCEVLMTTLIAPMMLMLQLRAVTQILLGRDGGWPANPRGEGNVPLDVAVRATWWIVLTGIASLALSALLAPEVVLWMLPVAVPMIGAPVLVASTSRPGWESLFHVPRDLDAGDVLERSRRYRIKWEGLPDRALPDAELA